MGVFMGWLNGFNNLPRGICSFYKSIEMHSNMPKINGKPRNPNPDCVPAFVVNLFFSVFTDTFSVLNQSAA